MYFDFIISSTKEMWGTFLTVGGLCVLTRNWVIKVMRVTNNDYDFNDSMTWAMMCKEVHWFDLIEFKGMIFNESKYYCLIMIWLSFVLRLVGHIWLSAYLTPTSKVWVCKHEISLQLKNAFATNSVMSSFSITVRSK